MDESFKNICRHSTVHISQFTDIKFNARVIYNT